MKKLIVILIAAAAFMAAGCECGEYGGNPFTTRIGPPGMLDGITGGRRSYPVSSGDHCVNINNGYPSGYPDGEYNEYNVYNIDDSYSRYEIQKIDGHEYIIFSGSYGTAAVHSESCKCKTGK